MSVYGSGGGGDYGGAMPAGGAYAQAPAPMTPTVRFEIIGEAWGLFQKQMGTWILSVFILFTLSFSLSFLLSFMGGLAGFGGRTSDADTDASLVSILYSIFTSLITNAVTYFLLGGLYRMALKQVRGQAINVGDMFSTGNVFVPLFLSMLLYGLSVAGGLILCIIPGFIVAGLMALAPVLIVDQRETSPIKALKASWNALKPDMLNATLFAFVLSILSSLGVLGCGVGLLFSYPLLPLGQALLYRDFFGLGTTQTFESGMTGTQNPWASGQPGEYPPPPADR